MLNINNLPRTGLPFKVQAMPEGVSTAAIRKAVMDGRRMKVLPYAEWQKFSWDEIRVLLHETAVYVAPTTELIEFLRTVIDGKKAIEIGAGSGNIGSRLGITMTDSYQQRDDKLTVQYYKLMGQPLIHYPPSVIKCDANNAVRRMSPHTVLACYVTHKWRDDTCDGNSKGVDFLDLFERCSRVVLVGNKETHAHNPLMSVPHQEIWLPGILTRSADPTTNRVFIWTH